MKNFDELTENELVLLSDEDIERYVSLKCAEDGIPFIPPNKPVKPAKDEVIGCDLIVYSIGDFKTTNEAKAQELLTLLKSMDLIQTDYDYSLGSEYRYAKELTDYNKPKLEVQKVFSREEYKKIEAKLASFKKLKEEYDDDIKAYNEAVDGVSEVRDDILTKISDARKANREKAKLREEWNRYLELAEGNTTIAFNFMQKIHPEISNYKDLEDELELSTIIG